MRQSVSIVLKVLQNFVTLFTVVMMVVIGGIRALHPSLHMDESLYLGAALRALHGDPLLTTFWLDKIPLGPLLTIPGILMTGEHAIGFHLSGLIAATIALLVGQSIIRELYGKNFLSIGAQVAYMAVLIVPFMIFHHASAFTDPFLLLFLVLFFRAANRSLNSEVFSIGDSKQENFFLEKNLDRRVHLYFTLALMTKFSAIMWSPILVGYWIIKFRNQFLREGIKRLWQAGRVLWLIALIYMMANPGKLAPIAWFSALLSKDKNSSQNGFMNLLIYRLHGWSRILSDILGHPFGFYGLWILLAMISLWCVYCVNFFWSRKTRSDLSFFWKKIEDIPPFMTRYLLLFLLPTWAHWFGLSLSGAALFPRYLYIFIPQLMFTVLVGVFIMLKSGELGFSSSFFPVARLSSGRAVAFLGLTLILGLGAKLLADSTDLFAYWNYVTHQTQDPKSSRILYAVRDELPQGSVIHHQARLWYLYPFIQRSHAIPACHESACLEEQQKGRAPFDRQFLLVAPEEGKKWDIYQTYPLSGGVTPFFVAPTHTQEVLVPTETILNEKNLRQALRIFGWAKDLTVTPGFRFDQPMPIQTGEELKNLQLVSSWLKSQSLPLLPLDIEIRVKDGFPDFLPKSFHIKGQITVSRGSGTQASASDQRWYLAYRLENILCGESQVDLVDLAPLVYGSYRIPLAILDTGPIASSSFQVVTALRWEGGFGNMNIKAHIRSKDET